MLICVDNIPVGDNRENQPLAVNRDTGLIMDVFPSVTELSTFF